jgi:hypothetical protein
VIWGSPVGPRVPPGAYQVRLSVGDWSDTVDLEITGDPRSDVADAEIAESFDLAKAIWRATARTHETLGVIRDVLGQAEAVAKRVDDEEVSAKVDELKEELTEIEGQLNEKTIQSSQDMLNIPSKLDNQLVSLLMVVDSAEGRPTQASVEYFGELEAQLNGLVSEMKAILDERLPELEELVAGTGAPRISVDRGDET